MQRILKCAPGAWLASIAVVICSSPAPCAAFQASQVVETIERNFPVEARPTVTIKNVDGRTRVRAGDSHTVQVRAVKEVTRADSREEAERAAADIKVRIEQVGNRIEVEAIYPRSWFSFGMKPRALVHFEIATPAQADIEANSVDGALEVRGIDGRLELATVDGELSGYDLAGRIDAHTVDGELALQGVRGEVKGHTVDGKLSIAGDLTSLEASSTDGAIDISAGQGSKIDNDWSVRSTDGDVQLELPAGLGAELDVETGDGRISNQLPMTIRGEISSHRLRGTINDGGGLIHIHTSDGSVTIVKS